MGGVAAVVLAAGEASRYGAPKQVLLLPQVLTRVARAAVDEIVVVEGAHRLDPPGDSARARLVRCAAWTLGPGASLRCGLAALGDEIDAAVVVLADGPDLSPAAVARVVDAWRSGAGDVVAASYGGARGHPVLVARPAWDGIPDDGLRDRAPALVPCDDLGDPGDVDRPEDLPERLRGRGA
jgi:CTP:molybdopterin cytidylyltransferase MocA